MKNTDYTEARYSKDTDQSGDQHNENRNNMQQQFPIFKEIIETPLVISIFKSSRTYQNRSVVSLELTIIINLFGFTLTSFKRERFEVEAINTYNS